jgi:hypothetical protein
MNQTANSDITNGLEKMMSGLEDMIQGLGKLPDDIKKNMSESDALAFSKQMDQSNLNDHIASATNSIEDLKNIFKQ